jgi:hypothetical protein
MASEGAKVLLCFTETSVCLLPSNRLSALLKIRFDRFDPKAEPHSLCDARHINLYPVRLEPVPKSLMHLRGQKGGSKEDGTHLEGGVFQPCKRTVTHPTLESVCSSLSFLRLLLSGWDCKPSTWRRPAPHRSRDSATERSTACGPPQRWRSAGYGPWRSLLARGTRR